MSADPALTGRVWALLRMYGDTRHGRQMTRETLVNEGRVRPAEALGIVEGVRRKGRKFRDKARAYQSRARQGD